MMTNLNKPRIQTGLEIVKPLRTYALGRRARLGLTLLKWGALLAIAYTALSLGELDNIRRQVFSFPLGGLLVFLLFGLLARLFYAWRWQIITVSLGIPGLKLGYLFRVNLLSEFVSIVLPSYLGGEGVRLLKLRRHGSTNRENFVSLVIDRVVGVMTLGLLTICFVPFLLPYLPASFVLPPALLPIGAAVLVVVLLLAFIFLRRTAFRASLLARIPLRLQTMLQGISLLPRVILTSVALTTVGHLLYASGYYILFRELTVVSYPPLLALTLVALLTASIPISIFGVEVSDGSLVVLAGLLAIPPETALVVVTLVVASRYFFSVCGFLLELLADGRQIFVQRNIQVIS